MDNDMDEVTDKDMDEDMDEVINKDMGEAMNVDVITDRSMYDGCTYKDVTRRVRMVR